MEKVKLIQKKFRSYLIKKKLFEFARQHKKYYSIYPSFISESTRKNKNLAIKIFLDYHNRFNYKIIPLKFCRIRNCYFFDIPKSKFMSSKKIMRFNFILNNQIIYDREFDIVNLGNTFVNQIDFIRYDKKERLLYKKFKQDFISNDSSSESSFSDFECSDEKKNKSKTTKKVGTKKYVNTNESSKIFSSSFSTMCSFKKAKIMSMKHLKVRSILKGKRNYNNFNVSKFNTSERKVSFGVVKFSY